MAAHSSLCLSMSLHAPESAENAKEEGEPDLLLSIEKVKHTPELHRVAPHPFPNEHLADISQPWMSISQVTLAFIRRQGYVYIACGSCLPHFLNGSQIKALTILQESEES